MANLQQRRRMRLNRLLMVIVIVVLALIVSSLYFAMRNIAASSKELDRHSFYQYVVQHHIGHLQEIDDGTGLDPISYVLTLPKPLNVPDPEGYVLNLMKLYVQMDHGQTLTIVDSDGSSQMQHPVADVHYDLAHNVVVVNRTTTSGQILHTVHHVNW